VVKVVCFIDWLLIMVAKSNTKSNTTIGYLWEFSLIISERDAGIVGAA